MSGSTRPTWRPTSEEGQGSVAGRRPSPKSRWLGALVCVAASMVPRAAAADERPPPHHPDATPIARGPAGQPAAEPVSADAAEAPAPHGPTHEHEPLALVVSPSSVVEPLPPVEVTVLGDRAPAGAVTLGRRQIREMPGVLGDPYRAIEVEPGVTPVASGVPYYFLRGAPPGNVGYFFDGIEVPLLFHVGAGPSVIPPGLVQRVELHMGPYPVTYGRFAGAIVEAQSVPPRDDWRGEAAFRGVDIGGLVEAPLPGEAGSVLVGGHYAVGAAVLSALVPSVDIGYWDYQGRLSVHAGRDARVTVTTFGAYDYLAAIDGDATDVLLDSDFHRLDTRYEKELDGGGRLRSGFTLGLDQSRGAGVKRVRNLKWGARTQVEQPVGSHLRLRAGLDATLDRYDVEHGGEQTCTTFVCEGGPLGAGTEEDLSAAFRTLFPSRTDGSLGFFADALIVLDERSSVTPGVRVDYYHSLGQSALAVDPRLVGRFQIAEWLRLVPAVGLASQPAGFPPLPGLKIGGLPGGLQRSFQSSLGTEVDVLPISLRGSVFRQAIFDLTDSIGGDRGGGFGADRFLARSTGDAYGLELSARGALTPNIFFLAAYTLSRTTRQSDGLTVPSAYDRTHVVQGALLFDLGKNWRAGVRNLLYTGFPAEEVNPYRERSTDPDRVKPFYRLDARLSKRWIFGDRAYVGMVFDMQNVTLAKEVFDVACDENSCTPREIGPITIPTLAFEAGY